MSAGKSSAKRRTDNREAAERFRKRKRIYIQYLEEQNRQVLIIQDENQRLQEQKEEMLVENQRLKEEIVQKTVSQSENQQLREENALLRDIIQRLQEKALDSFTELSSIFPEVNEF
jgi:uncharacterized protein YgiM (DUF1202 family)